MYFPHVHTLHYNAMHIVVAKRGSYRFLPSVYSFSAYHVLVDRGDDDDRVLMHTLKLDINDNSKVNR